MTTGRFAAALVAIACSLVLAGCLFRATEPPRFFRPGSASLDAATGERPAPPSTGAPLRLGNVRSAPFLRERIVWRISQVEYGLYEQRRWFELPTRYVRRALAAALQATSGIRLGQEASAPRLDVEILAFDEVLSPAHEAHVVLAATLRQGGETRFDRTFSATAPIASSDGAAMAEAMGRALDEVVGKIAAAMPGVLKAAQTPGRTASAPLQ